MPLNKRPCANHVHNSVQFRMDVFNLRQNATIFKFKCVNTKKKKKKMRCQNVKHDKLRAIGAKKP